MAPPRLTLRNETNGRAVVVIPKSGLGTRGAESQCCDLEGSTEVALIPVNGEAYPEVLGRKVRALVAKKIDSTKTGLAAPTGVLTDLSETDPDAPVRGITLPYAFGYGMDVFTSPNERTRNGLVPWGIVERAHCAAALLRVQREHESAVVAKGDFNPSNLIYNQKANRVLSIDPLAWAFEHQGRWYGTGATRPEFLAPELQSKWKSGGLAGERIGVRQERFSLATFLFLLFTDALPAAYGRARPDAIERKQFACVCGKRELPDEAKVPEEVYLAFLNLHDEVKSLIALGLKGAPNERPSPDRYLSAVQKMLPVARVAAPKPKRLPFNRRKSAMAACAALALSWTALRPTKPPVGTSASTAPPHLTVPTDEEKPRRPVDPDAWKQLAVTRPITAKEDPPPTGSDAWKLLGRKRGDK